MIVNNKIRVALAEKNMQVQDFAELIGVSIVTASRWVNNRQQPSLQTLGEIALALDIDICSLIKLVEKGEEEEELLSDFEEAKPVKKKLKK